ncbi:hypothetical protein WS86_06585 [Burkholderia savannae]|nr:hypothetical protein WS86_06585 [Burkholderia savannae]
MCSNRPAAQAAGFVLRRGGAARRKGDRRRFAIAARAADATGRARRAHHAPFGRAEPPTPPCAPPGR